MQGKIIQTHKLNANTKHEYTITIRRLGRKRFICEATAEHSWVRFITKYRIARSLPAAETIVAKARLAEYMRMQKDEN